MYLVDIVIDDTKFVVTGAFASTIKALCREAAVITEMGCSVVDNDYPLYLTCVGPRLIAVVKEIRVTTGCSLRDGKDLVDRVALGHRALIGKFSYPEGARIAAQFAAVGATVDFPSALELLAREGE